MSKINLREKLCLHLCPHYKPSKKEELACKGYLIVERFVEEGREIPFVKSDKLIDAVTERMLRQHLCSTCSFYESDCDFAQQQEGAFPCGGFLLLGKLIEEHILSIDNMKDIR